MHNSSSKVFLACVTYRAPLHMKETPLRIITVGGVEEIGINMTVYEYGEDLIVVDAGFGFPGPSMPSVHYVLPNYSWLVEHKARIRAVLITHAHMDHIGALGYMLPHIGNPPMYTMPLTAGLITRRLEEFGLEHEARIHAIHPDDVLKFGEFTIEFYRVNHNIPDAIGVSISTPLGRVVHTGDWKFDWTPVNEKPAEIDKLALWGGGGNVLALLSDSTNARKSGYTASEQTLGATIDTVFQGAAGRIIFTCNSQLFPRIQRVFDAAKKYHREVMTAGRSISQNIETAIQLGYLQVDPDVLIDGRARTKLPDHRLVILTTGAQGEERSGLPRMARGDFPRVQLKAGDTAVVSANPIPGNEHALYGMVSNLQRQGIDVVYNQTLDIHVSGHAAREEHKLMMGLVKPKYLVPIHGERHMIAAHAKIGIDLGIEPLTPYNGDAIVFHTNGKVIVEKGAVPAERMYVDDVGHAVLSPEFLSEQQTLGSDGMISIILSISKNTGRLLTEPTIVSRGFMYIKGNEHIIREVQHEVKKICNDGKVQQQNIGEKITTHISDFLFLKTNRKPLVLPVITEF